MRVSKKFNAIFIFHIQDTIIMPKTRSRKKNPLTLAYFKDNDANVQKDYDFFNFARNALRFRTEFTLFPKPVCFASSPHQQEFKVKNRTLMKTCACFSSFCQSTKYKKNSYHIAVVEGRCHPTKYSMPRPPPTEYEFHSCILVVDKLTKSIFVFNPWKLGARPLVMNYISDIQPNLVRRPSYLRVGLLSGNFLRVSCRKELRD